MAKPLIILNPSLEDNDKEGGIVSITWMEMRPCVFFALDSQSRWVFVRLGYKVILYIEVIFKLLSGFACFKDTYLGLGY